MFFRIVFFCFIFQSASSKPGFRFANLSTKDGLPENVVKSIVQDSQGFIWFATQKGLAKYDGYNINPIVIGNNSKPTDVTALANNGNQILVGTKNKGLFSYKDGKVESIELFDLSMKPLPRIRSILVENDSAWIATSTGLFNYQFTNKTSIKNSLFKHMSILSLSKKNQNELVVLTAKTFYVLNISTNSITTIPVKTSQDNKNTTVFVDKNEIWLGRRDGLYKYNKSCACFIPFKDTFQDNIIYSITKYKEWLWVGTLYNGLYLYNSESDNTYHYKYNALTDEHLSDDNIISMFIDSNNILWLGTFRSGVDYVNLRSLDFGMSTQKSNPIPCAKSHVIYDFFEESNDQTWIATDRGLVELNPINQNCRLYNHSTKYNKTLSSDIVRSIFIDKKDNHWISTSSGLNQMDHTTKEIRRVNEIPGITFIAEFSPKKLLLGSLYSLYLFDTENDEIIKIKQANGNEVKVRFNDYSKNANNNYVFSTYQGIYRLSKKLELEKINLETSQLNNKFMSSAIYENEAGTIWFAANYSSLYQLDRFGKLENITKYISKKGIEIASIVATRDVLWISSNIGLTKYNTITQKSTNFNSNDGLQDDEYLISSYHKSASGKIYFGGIKGYNAFNPALINTQFNKPRSLISRINIDGKEIKVTDITNAGFEIKHEANGIKQLVLNHKDNKIDIEFSSSDFTDTTQNKFSYRLLGINDSWENTLAVNRKAVYTNLPAGNYIFQVKTANKYGLWSENKEIEISVYPAPWFSSIAFLIYFILLITFIVLLIRYTTLASRKKSIKLEKIVNQRTHELNLKNKIVNSLLEYKNEVLANVTHEFKTPLTLILGPTQQLINEDSLLKHRQQLKMIERNASRLMLMVGQILKLSQAEVNKEVLRVPQSVKPILMMLSESFKTLVLEKNINFKLVNEIDATINATSECLEIVIGNLLSNALKFTNSGDEISLSTELNGTVLSVNVKDSGCGIESKDLSRIFNRFTRLDQHKNIQGTGIGLSVVKEITELNNGQVSVSSNWGIGSSFTVQFPISSKQGETESSNLIATQIVENTKNELINVHNQPLKQKFYENRFNVLIIEDNIDMQTYIGTILHENFNCSFATRGAKGISLALQDVPDIIICDVMMPGLDGYQVTRTLRHDTRTSHIPIVLLTALNTKESRIKGWRENIDTYISKPFDETELIVQLENILTIRKLLQKETNTALNNKTPINSIDLPKLDLVFIEKMKATIGQHYGNEYFQIADLASKMAMGERQLQRKLKALINTSPMEMLRDYRLKKATQKLKDGYQVSITSDECGFSSLSYFGRCFKKKYGITPKKYQTLNKKTPTQA